MTDRAYTSTLNAGYGMVSELQTLLQLWEPSVSTTDLHQQALASGLFPSMSARRLRNLVVEGFAPYLRDEGAPAKLLKRVQQILTAREIKQLMFIYTSRAHPILADFVREVYWNAYTAGRDSLSAEDSRAFVRSVVRDGKTTTAWSEGTINRVASYLTSYCADFGLLERGIRSTRKILTYWIEPNVAVILAHDLHFSGLGDNAVLAHPDWTLFGMQRGDVLEELKRLALQDWLIVQSAGGVTRISWTHQSMEDLANELAKA